VKQGTDRWGTLLVLAAFLLFAGCGGEEGGTDVEFKVPVSVKEVTTGTVEDLVVATGTLRAAKVVTLRTDSAGALQVEKGPDGSRLAEGDPVQKGQLVVSIVGEDVRLAARTEANRKRYEAALEDYQSKHRLFEDGLISETELRPAETALADAKLELDRSLHTEQRARLATPMSGVILKLARDEQQQLLADGQLISAGQTVADIADISRLIADVNLVGPDAARVRPGQEVRLRHHAWEEKPFHGKVVRMAPTVDPTTRTLRVEVELDNQERLLRPGMFIEATIVAERRPDVPVVPRTAVTERAGRKVVFVLKGQKVEMREVAPGLGGDKEVEIRSGVAPGEKVVVRGLETLTDDARVRVSGT